MVIPHWQRLDDTWRLPVITLYTCQIMMTTDCPISSWHYGFSHFKPSFNSTNSTSFITVCPSESIRSLAPGSCLPHTAGSCIAHNGDMLDDVHIALCLCVCVCVSLETCSTYRRLRNYYRDLAPRVVICLLVSFGLFLLLFILFIL